MHREPHLPPLAALRAFEAAARHGSFTRAAAELGMTQAGVSYQIRILEERIGAKLFLRRPRALALTHAGQALAPAVSDAFERLSTAYAAAKGGAQAVLRITTTLTFASQWLARRLGAFQFAHPTVAVRLDTSQSVLDFGRDEIDVAVRTGTGGWPGLSAHRLMPIDFTPMLSPKLAASIGGVQAPADLLKLPIIGPRDPWWPLWFASAGIADAGLAARPDISLGSQAHETSAAAAGHGVAILTRAFVAAELADGRLVEPFDLVCSAGDFYWLVYPEARRNAPKIRAFRDWLLAEFALPNREPPR